MSQNNPKGLYCGSRVVDINEPLRGPATVQSFDRVHPIHGQLVTLHYERLALVGRHPRPDRSFTVSGVPASSLEVPYD